MISNFLIYTAIFFATAISTNRSIHGTICEGYGRLFTKRATIFDSWFHTIPVTPAEELTKTNHLNTLKSMIEGIRNQVEFSSVIQGIRQQAQCSFLPSDSLADEANVLMDFMNQPERWNLFLHQSQSVEKDRCLCCDGERVIDIFCLLAKYVKKAQSELERNKLNVDSWILSLLLTLYETYFLFDQKLFEGRYDISCNDSFNPRLGVAHLNQVKKALFSLYDFFKKLEGFYNLGLLSADEDIKLLAKYSYGVILRDLVARLDIQCKRFIYKHSNQNEDSKVFLVLKSTEEFLNYDQDRKERFQRIFMRDVTSYADAIELTVGICCKYLNKDGTEAEKKAPYYLAIEVKGLEV